MVIKDEKGKPVILLTKEDIMEYVMEKCGFEIRLELETMIEDEETKENKYREYEDEIESLKDNLYDSEKENEYLRRKVEDLEENCETYKRLAKKGGKNESTSPKI